MSTHLVRKAIRSCNFNRGWEVEDDSLFFATVRPNTSLPTKPSFFHRLAHLYSIRRLGLRECFRGVFIAETSTVRLSVFFGELANKNSMFRGKPRPVSNY